MTAPRLTDREFADFQRFIYDAAGIALGTGKKALVVSRLARRLSRHKFRSYSDYFGALERDEIPGEAQVAVDLLTTNETYFFREAKQFDVLRTYAEAETRGGRQFRVWSAASSTGEEAYSIAMVLADRLPIRPWEVIGSDISTRVLRHARRAQYLMERAQHVPPEYLKRFCLRGTGEHEGTLLIERGLRERVRFCHVNLNAPLPPLGAFDVIFLRNVLIYFDVATRRRVVERVVSQLRPGGLFLVGHAESLNEIPVGVEPVAPAIYVKS